MSISSLPEEIYEEVIIKMPVKSIFMGKCVCKLWCNLISTSEFIKDHLKLPLCLNTNQLTSFIVVNKSSLCYVEYDFDNDEQFSQKPTKELINLGCLGFDDTGEQDIVIVGSCNGLVCLTTKIDRFLFGPAYICNPITRECLQLPSQDHGCEVTLYGFGYVASSNEYKVVRISYSGDEIYVDVYTIGDGRGWRYREKITTEQLLCSSTQGILVDGALFWIDEVCPIISVFDLTDEKLYMLSLPPPSPSDQGKYKLGVLRGQLCCFRGTTCDSSVMWLLGKNIDDSYVKEQDGKHHSPWIWSKESGKDEHSPWIWSKGPTETLEGLLRYQLLTTAKDGDVLLFCREKRNQGERENVIIRYDAKTSDSKELGDLGFLFPGRGKAAKHVNSYISLKLLGEENVFARL